MDKNYGLGVVLSADDKLSGALKNAERDIARYRRAALKDMESVRTYSARLGDDLKQMRRSIGTGMQFMAAGAAIAAPFVMLSKAAIDSEDKLSDVMSLISTDMAKPQARRAVHEFSKEISRVGRESRNTRGDLEGVAYALTSALGIQDAVQVLGTFDKTAIATKGTLDDMTKIGTRILSSYGEKWVGLANAQEKSVKMGNILSGTVKRYNTDLSLLAPALSYTIGQSSALGIALEDMTSTIAMAQTLGLPDTIAGTSFAAMVRTLSKLKDVPTDSIFSGMNITDQFGNLLPIYDIILQLEKKLGISTDKMKDLAKQGIYGADALAKLNVSYDTYAEIQGRVGDEGSRLFLALLGHGEQLKENAKWIKETNNLEAMWAARMDNVAAKIQMTKNKIREASIVIGESWLGMEGSLIGELGGFAEKVAKWAEDNPELVEAVGRAAGTLAGGAISIGLGIALSAIGKALLKHPMVLGVMTGAWLGDKAYKAIAGDTVKDIDEYMKEQKKLLHAADYDMLVERSGYAKMDRSPYGMFSRWMPDEYLTSDQVAMNLGLRGSDPANKSLNQKIWSFLTDDSIARFLGMAPSGEKKKKEIDEYIERRDKYRPSAMLWRFMTDDSIARFLFKDNSIFRALGLAPQKSHIAEYFKSHEPIDLGPSYDYRKRPYSEATGPTLPRTRQINVDVRLTGNLLYDVPTMVRLVKKSLEAELTLSPQGEF